MKGYTKKHRFVGRRVELHPGCDLWMRGAKFGTVVMVNDQGGNIRLPTLLKIRMDHPKVLKLQVLPCGRADPLCVKCARTMRDGEWHDRCENCADPS
jgi:hypothetical protein